MKKTTSIQDIISSVQKTYEKNKKTIGLYTGDALPEASDIPVIPLKDGNPLRVLLGLDGLPFNKIIEIAGKPDTGKSTLAAEAMLASQANDTIVVLWDSEDKFSPGRFQRMGGDVSKLLVIKTNEILVGGEAARKIITEIKSQNEDAKILFVWDSVGGSQSRSHAERELDNERHAQPGQDAKENGSVMKVLVSLINKYPDSLSVLLINQTYDKIGFMQKGDAITGGTKIEYHSSFIVKLKRIKTTTKQVKGIAMKTGIWSRASVLKNHISTEQTSIHQLDFVVDANGTSLLDTANHGVANDEED